MNRKWTLSKQSFCKLLGHWQKRIVSKTKCIWPKLLKPQLCLCCLLFPPVEPTMAEAPKYGLVIRSDGSVLMGDEGMPTFDSGLAAVLSSVMKVVQKKRKSARRRRPTTPLQLPLPLIPVSMIWRKPMKLLIRRWLLSKMTRASMFLQRSQRQRRRRSRTSARKVAKSEFPLRSVQQCCLRGCVSGKRAAVACMPFCFSNCL